MNASRADEAAKVAVVTGAGTGVGRAAALALAAEGFALVLSGRRPEPIKDGGVGDRIWNGCPICRFHCILFTHCHSLRFKIFRRIKLDIAILLRIQNVRSYELITEPQRRYVCVLGEQKWTPRIGQCGK